MLIETANGCYTHKKLVHGILFIDIMYTMSCYTFIVEVQYARHQVFSQTEAYHFVASDAYTQVLDQEHLMN